MMGHTFLRKNKPKERRPIIMNEWSTETTKAYTSCASLAALRVKVRAMKLFEPIRQKVKIAQKTVKDAPIEKLYDGWIAMLAGAHGLVEINSRLRADEALQAAFGRSRCAEQSVVQPTLDACTPEWADDPKVPRRQVGWVQVTASEYVRQMRHLAVRCRKAHGQWGVGVLLATLGPVEVLALTQPTAGPDSDPVGVLLAYVCLYDQRGGGVEISFKGDNQGLGSTKRSKKHLRAQQVIMLLGSLAYNVIVCALRWLAAPNSATMASCVWCVMSFISLAFSSGMLPARSARSFSIALPHWPPAYAILCWVARVGADLDLDPQNTSFNNIRRFVIPVCIEVECPRLKLMPECGT
jgi:hypothetical protein